MASDCSDDPAEGVDSLVVVYADELLPRLYEMSHISQDQLPKHSGMQEKLTQSWLIELECLEVRMLFQ